MRFIAMSQSSTSSSNFQGARDAARRQETKINIKFKQVLRPMEKQLQYSERMAVAQRNVGIMASTQLTRLIHNP